MRTRTSEELEFLIMVEGARPLDNHVQKAPHKDRKALYTITTIAPGPRFGGQRTPAICDNLERAREIVENNEGDIWECSYYLAVIEAVFPNYLYSSSYSDERYWYRYNTGTRRYEPIETPEWYKNTFGFGIG